MTDVVAQLTTVEKIAAMIAHLRANVGFGTHGSTTDEGWARYIVEQLRRSPAEHAPPDTLARFIGALLEQQHSDKWWESVPPDVKDVYRTYANEAREIVARGSRPSLAGGREEQIDAIAKLMQDRYPFRAAFAQIAREMYDAGVRAALSDREGKMNHD